MTFASVDRSQKVLDGVRHPDVKAIVGYAGPARIAPHAWDDRPGITAPHPEPLAALHLDVLT